MGRTARLSGEFLHLVVRGIGKQILFEDDMDRSVFLSRLESYSAESEVTVMAYCLMDNHVHLLIQDPNGNCPMFMKQMGVSYASYFNKKYDRIGHLFQDRYKSSVISDSYGLVAVYRYILNNPAKAGLCPADKYSWSSYREYGMSGGLTDTTLLVSLIGDWDNYEQFMNVSDDTDYLEYDEVKHDDAWAIGVIKKILNVPSGTVIRQMEREQRDESLRLLKGKGITIRQMERVTGIGRGIIQRALKMAVG